MNARYMSELYTNLDILIKEGEFNNKFIVVFGSNKPAEKTILYLNSKGINVDAIIDNDKNKNGVKMLGITVCSPDKALKEFKDNAIILIASMYYNEMCMQLKQLGYEKDIHIFGTIKYMNYSVSEETFSHKTKNIMQGNDVLENIQKKYGANKFIIVCPYNGLGDIFFICSYMNEYINKNKINDFVFTVVGNTCKRVASMFDIENIEVLQQDESDYLVNFYLFMKADGIPIKILSHNYIHTDILYRFEISKTFSFGFLFKQCVMELNEDAIKVTPKILYREDYLEDLFEENNLIKGKTIILSPYANTVVRLEDGFWEKISEILIEKGYTVCTNGICDEEPAITGTIQLRFPLEDAVSVIEYAGGFIGVRSGLCDLLSPAKAKKIILYPNESSLFFNIKDMGLSHDFYELSSHNYKEDFLSGIF